MLGSKLTELAEEVAPAQADLLYIVSGGVSKKVTASKLLSLQKNALTFFMPMAGVTDDQFDLTGEVRVISAGETTDYATDFGAQNQHIYILVNSITTGGDIVVTGTSLSESTAVPVVGDTETIPVDTTTNQYYQSDKKWLEITNIDVSSGSIVGINYDVGIVGYIDLGNIDFTVVGYRAEFKTTTAIGDVRLRIRKIQDDGLKKMSIVPIEDFGFDSTVGNGSYYDHIRSGANDRSYLSGSDLAPADVMVVFKMGDFNTYFSNDENILECSSKAEGLVIDFLGEPSAGISAIDHCTLSIYYTRN